MSVNDVEAAARLVALSLAPGRRSAASGEYRHLVERCLSDEAFNDQVAAIARGFDLQVIGLETRAGLVLGTTDETAFKVSIADIVRSGPDRPIYLLAHLLIAAEAFPGKHDLDDASFTGRVTVDALDERVRDAMKVLDRKAAAEGANLDPPANQPGLEPLWRYYYRRPATDARSEKRTTTRVLVKRALDHLYERGMMTRSSQEAGGTYTTTAKYRIHVRELAGYELLEELAALGIAHLPTGPAPIEADTLWND